MGRPVVHFEIGSNDAGRLERFYTELFDWEVDAQNFGGYHLVEASEESGIGGGIMQTREGVPPYLTIYVEVDDLEGHLRKAEALGGERVVPPTPIPGVGAFAMFKDPDGNVIGLIHGGEEG